MENKKVKKIKELIDCDKKQNELGGIIVVNRQFLIEEINLINELESENERLIEESDLYKKQFNALEPRFFDLREENKQLKDRIAELEKKNKDYYDRLNNLQTYIDNHEEIWKGNTNNALNKFAKKLKEKVHERDYVQGYAEIGLCEEIDETLKEFLGGEND